MDAIGSTTKPIYIDSDGAAKPLSGTVGSSTRPIYLNAGQPTQCNLNVETWTFEALDGTTTTKNVSIQV